MSETTQLKDDVGAQKELRSLSVEGFPRDMTLEDLSKYFKQFGDVENIIMRKFQDKQSKKLHFNGSVFVTFCYKEQASKFIMSKNNYKDSKLTTFWKYDYIQRLTEDGQNKDMEDEKLKVLRPPEDGSPTNQYNRGLQRHGLKTMANCSALCDTTILNNFLSFSSSRKIFVTKYKKGFVEKEKIKSFYLQILIEIYNTIRFEAVEKLRNINNVLDYLNDIENKSWLNDFYNDESNPLLETNIIILACEYNSLAIVKYLLEDRNKIIHNLTTALGRSTIYLCDQNKKGHTAFYYAIRENNLDILTLLTKTCSYKFKASALEDVLSKTYEEIKVKNIYVSKKMQIFVERELINQRLFLKEVCETFTSIEKPCSRTTLSNVLQRIDLVLDKIRLLKTEYLNKNKVDHKFLFIAGFIAQNIHVLKRQLKSTYARLPWEEIEFCLVSFILSRTKHQKINLVYNSVLTKYKLFIHLGNFEIRLSEEKASITEADVNSNIPNLNREQVVCSIVSKHKSFDELYNDYEQIRNYYSLVKISQYIDLALSANGNEYKGPLIIQRALLLIGEHLKNTLESPNLSYRITEILLTGLQNDTIVIIKSLRNLLTHSFSLSRRIDVEKNKNVNFFSNVQNDLRKIKLEVNDLIYQYEFNSIRELIEKAVNSQDETITLLKIFRTVPLKIMDSENEECEELTTEFEMIAKLLGQLKDKLKNKTQIQKHLLHKIESIFKIHQKPLETNDKNSIKILLYQLQYLSRMSLNNNNIQEIKSLLNLIYTHYMKNKIELSTLENISMLSKNIVCDNNTAQYCKKIQMLHNDNAEKILLESISDSKFFEEYNCNEIKRIVLKITHIAKFRMKSVRGIEKFKTNLEKTTYESRIQTECKKIYLKDCLIERLESLNNILVSKELTTNLLERFSFYEDDKMLQTYIEMLVLDATEALQGVLGNNLLSLDECSPILIGKTLRNHLAHYNAFVDILPYDPSIAVILNAIKLVDQRAHLTEHFNVFLGQPISENIFKLEQRFNHNLNNIVIQKELDDALKDANFEKVLDSIGKGADIQTMSINKRTSLHRAVAGGNLEIVKFLLNAGLDISATDINGFDVSYFAANYKRKNIIKFLIEQRCLSSNKTYVDGRTLLHIVSQNGDIEIVKILLKNNADSKVKDISGNAPLHYAVINNHKQIVELLLNGEISVDSLETKGGFTSLHVAAEKGHLELVDFLIVKLANVNAENDNNSTPLHLSAMKGHINIVKTLVTNGANINAIDNAGSTPLYYAAEYGNEHVANYLIEHGANVNIVNKNFFAPIDVAAKYGYSNICKVLLNNNANVKTVACNSLHFAAENGHHRIIKALIKSKASINGKTSGGQTPLILAVRGSHIESIELLIKSGADIDAKDKYKFTPLHYAAKNDSKKIVQFLINEGADINAMASDGNTALHLAIQGGYTEVVEVLITAQPNIVNKVSDNLPPLHLAALCGNKKIVEMLVKKHANINNLGNYNLTPLHCAAMSGNRDTIQILLENGASINNVTSDSKITPLQYAIFSGSKDAVDILLQKGIKYIDFNSNYIYLAVMQNNKEIVELLIKNGVIGNFEDGLTLAIRNDNYNIVKVLLTNKGKVSLKDMSVNSLLIAAYSGNKKIITILLSYGAEVNAVNKDNVTPLFIAAQKGDEEIVNLLIENGAYIDFQTNDGYTPLHVAAETGHTDTVEVLLKKGANINIRDFKNRTALELAVAHGHVAAVKLLQRYAYNNNVSKDNNWSLLHIAAQEGNIDILQYLIKNGADINAKNTSGSKAIHIAAREGHSNVVDIFLSLGFTVNEPGAANQSLLHYAALGGHLKVIKYLIGKKIDVNAKDENGMTPLHIAAKYDHSEICNELLINSAIYNSVDKFNCTPIKIAKSKNIFTVLEATNNLFKAVKSNKLSDVVIYINAGACVNAKNDKNATPLLYAAWKGYENISNTLIQNKANPNISDGKGCSPLHYAVKFSHFEIVKDLLSNGAIYNAKDKNGKIPLNFAVSQTIINLLKIIEESFKNVQEYNTVVIDVLTREKNVDIIRAVVNALNQEKKSLLVTAIQNNFPQVEKLKQLLQDNVSLHIYRANILLSQENFKEALIIFEDIYRQRIKIFGLENPSVLDIQYDIATVLYKQKKYLEAFKSFKDIYQKQRDILGDHCKDTLKTRSALGLVLHRLGKDEEALIIYEEIYQKQQQILELDDADILNTELHMALVLDRLKRYDEALNINQNVLRKAKKSNLKSHFMHALSAQNNIALVFMHQNQYDDALKTFNEVYEQKKSVLGPHHSDTLRTLHNIVGVLCGQEKYDEALKAYEKIFDTQKTVLGPNHLDTLNTQNNIANLLFSQGNIQRALTIYKQCLNQRKTILGDNHPEVLHTIKIMKIIYEALEFKGVSVSNIDGEQENIYISIKDSDIDNIKRLIRGGIDINTKDMDGRTLLFHAVYNKDIRIVKLLLEHGADMTQKSIKGNTPLHIAVVKDDKEIIETLLHVTQINPKIKSNFVNAKTILKGTTALHIAAENDKKELVQILLGNGAFYDVKNNDGKIPRDLAKPKSDVKGLLCYIDELFEAVENNESQKIDCLFKKQSNIVLKTILSVRNSNTKTLMQVAKQKDIASKILGRLKVVMS